MIIVTGGAGFIGSSMVWKLNQQGITDILIVDHLGTSSKWKNLVNLKFTEFVHKDNFLKMVEDCKMPDEVSAIIHMGACSSTTEKDSDYLMENNYRYTVKLAEWALRMKVQFIYASSAATYGDGNYGFTDDDSLIDNLKPLNMYGYSKHLFDLWAKRNSVLNKMVGLKFFNVFGPNEYHKNDMSSVVFKSFHQIKETGKVKLFKSYQPKYKDGEQLRDFIYVKDCVEVIWWFLNNPQINGLFNLGTGKSRHWNDLVSSTFRSMGLEPNIEFIDMPENLKNSYQYFTEAEMAKLFSAGYKAQFMSLEDSVKDYVQNYLMKSDPFLKQLNDQINKKADFQ